MCLGSLGVLVLNWSLTLKELQLNVKVPFGRIDDMPSQNLKTKEIALNFAQLWQSCIWSYMAVFEYFEGFRF